MKRTEYCGLIRPCHIGTEQICSGWVITKRDMGGVIFLDLRDREGVLQVVIDAAKVSAEEFNLTERLRMQSVICVKGKIRKRSLDTVNPKIETGTVELATEKIELLSMAERLPYSIDEGDNVREDLRLRYRYLDIRRSGMVENLRMRHLIQKATQDYLDSKGFIYVETPILCKSTPEGARDYLVPSRVHQGSFYALPQSPQIYKQLLMVGGIDKYYQVARCFRDEDLRADRQPEFTQVDMEMSFVEQEDIWEHLENLFKHIFKCCKGEEIGYDFPVLPGPKLWINTVLINRIFALIYRLLTLQILQVVAPLRFSGRCATTAELYAQSTPKAVPDFRERKLKTLQKMQFHTEQKVWLGSPTVLTVRYIPFLPNILMKRK